MNPTDPIRAPSRLGRQLMLRLLTVVALLIVLFTAAQIYIDYRRDIGGIENRFRLIETSYLGSVTEDLWVADREHLVILLEGLVRLPGLIYAEVHVDGALYVSAGKRLKTQDDLTRVFPLVREYRGKQLVLGELVVAADFSEARQNVISSAWHALLTIAIETSIVALFLYYFVHSMVTRHLVQIARYVSQASVAHLDLPLHLQRDPSPPGKSDEFDQLVAAFNGMRQKLLLSYESLRTANADLEQRVAERTVALQHQVEDSLRSQRALKSSQNQLQAIFDSALEGIVVADSRGLVTVFNPAAERLFGFSAGEIVGASLNRLMPENIAGLHDDYMRRYITTDQSRIVGSSREVVARRADGSLFPIQLAVSEARISEERLFIGIMHDLSERKSFEEALLQAKITAEEANRAKSEFLSRMSHELRTPLNAIIGFGQLLATDPVEPPTPGQKENADQILLAGRHLLVLINEILDLARIESGRTELSLEPVDLVALVAELQMLMLPLAEQAGVALHTSLPSAEPVVARADRLRLKQCLLNLLSNAIKYNRRPGTVWLRVGCANGQVAIEVEDSGIGFTAEQRQRLFTPFDRLGRDQGAEEGAGIGLAITRRLVEIMGGQIEAEGRPGRGSTFTLRLPAAVIAADAMDAMDAGEAAEIPLRIDPDTTGRALRVLYVEDNPANVSLVQKAMRRRPKVALEIAGDGLTGLARAVETLPDLILLDLDLPELDGYEVIARLRNDTATRSIRVVAVTASAMSDDEGKVRRAGFDGYLSKPFEIEALYRLLDEA